MHTSSLPGKLIVIDGIDGAGKTTQAKLLADTLAAQSIRTHYLHFPRYDTFFGQTIKRFLDGEFGDIESTSPYLCSITYALDRQQAKAEIQAKLEQGIHVITDRYTSSNLAHQGGRCQGTEAQDAFVAWNKTLEYQQLGVLPESIVLFLDTPPEIARTLRARRSGSEDILEQDDDHQQQTYELYCRLAGQHDHWHTISCHKAGALCPQEEIQRLILEALNQTIFNS